MPTIKLWSITAVAVLAANAATTTVSPAGASLTTATLAAGSLAAYGSSGASDSSYTNQEIYSADEIDAPEDVYPPANPPATSLRLVDVLGDYSPSSSKKSMSSTRPTAAAMIPTGRLAPGIVVTTDKIYPTLEVVQSLMKKTTKTATLSLTKTTTLSVRATAIPSLNAGTVAKPGYKSKRVFHVPAGQPDGIYEAFFDEDEAEVHERIGSLTKAPKKWMSRFGGRHAGNGTVSAGKTIPQGSTCRGKTAPVVNRDEVLRAAYNLGRNCDTDDSDAFDEPSSQYALAGGSIVFVCSQADPKSNADCAGSCSTKGIMSSVNRLLQRDECNLTEAWDTKESGAKPQHNYAVGYAKVTEGFCGHEQGISADGKST